MVLIPIIMMIVGAMRFGAARLSAGETATQQAFHDAASGTPPQYADQPGPAPAQGYSGIRPGLPLRMHTAVSQKQMTLYTGDAKTTGGLAVSASVSVPGPTWAFSGYPAGGGDRAAVEQWFTDYTSDSRQALMNPLGLAEDWAP